MQWHGAMKNRARTEVRQGAHQGAKCIEVLVQTSLRMSPSLNCAPRPHPTRLSLLSPGPDEKDGPFKDLNKEHFVLKVMESYRIFLNQRVRESDLPVPGLCRGYSKEETQSRDN